MIAREGGHTARREAGSLNRQLRFGDDHKQLHPRDPGLNAGERPSQGAHDRPGVEGSEQQHRLRAGRGGGIEGQGSHKACGGGELARSVPRR